MKHLNPVDIAVEPPTVSVLMSTYVREKAENLEACLESLCRQTRAPDEVVLVVDGPVGEAQEQVIERFRASADAPRAVLVRLPRSGGLANAMNAGLGLCTGTYVMRMDSDDICQPDRVELQMDYMTRHPETDVVSSWSEEFFEDGGASQIKVSPVRHEDVVRSLRWRNVLVHPTVMARRACLLAVEGYRTKFGLLEDYDLFVRLAQGGARFHVIPKTLVRVRSSLDQRGRRGGWRYIANEIRFRSYLYRSGFVTGGEFAAVTTLYVLFRLLSGGMRKRLYGLARTQERYQAAAKACLLMALALPAVSSD